MQRAQARRPPTGHTGPPGQFLVRPLHIAQAVREDLADFVGDLEAGARHRFS